MKDVISITEEWKACQKRSFRIIAFGSSNTELSWHNKGRHNWVEWFNINIRANVGRNVTVINQGISGETTRELLTRIDRDVFSFQPSMVIVTIGGNDAAKGISSANYSNNLRRLCSMIKNNNALPILQTYYCPMYHEGREGFERDFEILMQINREISKEMDLPIIDQYKIFEPFYRNDKNEYKKLMRDWIHLNHLGNLIMGMNVSKYFGLPDVKIPEDIQDELKPLIGQMFRYTV